MEINTNHEIIRYIGVDDLNYVKPFSEIQVTRNHGIFNVLSKEGQ